MVMETIVKKMPRSLWETTSESLIEVILNSTNATKMPSSLAKTILFYWQRDQLATEIGLQRLLEASMILEPEKTVDTLETMGLHEPAIMLKSTMKA